jgi:dUTP pyrophosphatase
MKVNIKKTHPDAVIPKQMTEGAAGLDLTAVSVDYDNDRAVVVYDTGLAFEIPEGYVGLVFPRSSISKTSMRLSNAVGVLDSDYRGSLYFKFDIKPDEEMFAVYEVGDRIGQLVILPYPQIELVEVDELNDTARGLGGYGSTKGLLGE